MESDSIQEHNKYTTILITDIAPTIDGILNDIVWQNAIPITDFLQEEPENLHPPTENTEVRLLYDNKNIYVYARMYDNNPDKIFGRIARRDDWFEGFNNSDRFIIDFDSRHDHQTAYSFGVNSIGVQWDAMLLEDSIYDEDWNAIWHAKTTTDSLGWSLEMEIPFSVLRYISDNTEWGISIERFIQRKNELIKWQAFPRGTKGKSSIYSHLKGFEKLPIIQDIELKPYLFFGNHQFHDYMLVFPDSVGNEFMVDKSNNFHQNEGIDIKYHINSNSVIDFTLKPDFGQIEADPSMINLSAYETRFDEKRPFFMENSGIFDTPIELFYSRRIGEEIDSVKFGDTFKPVGSKLDSIYLDGVLLQDSITIHQDNELISATKLTGKTATGYSYGIIYGVSKNKFFLKDLNDNYNHYFVSRLTKDVLRGNSYFGIMTSHMDNSFKNSHNISVDGTLFLYNNQIEMSSQIVQSNNNGIPGKGMYGFASYHHPEYFSIMFESDYYDKEFNLKNTGYLSRNNFKKNRLKVIIRRQKPWKIIHYTSFGIEYNQEKNIDNLLLGNEIEFEYAIQFTNYWNLISFYYYNTEHFNDLLTYDFETGKIGPITKLPEAHGYSINVISDDSKNLSGSISIGHGTNNFGDYKNTYIIDIIYEPNNYVSLQLGYKHIKYKEIYHWLEIIEVTPGIKDYDIGGPILPGGPIIGNEGTGNEDSLRFIFSNSTGKLNNLTSKFSFNYSKELSFQFYSEYYRKHDKFHNYSELFEDNQYPVGIMNEEQNPYSETGEFPFEDDKFLNPNYYTGLFPKYGELNTNLVLKWEFSPGSNLYLVYSINKAVSGRMFNNFKDFLKYDTLGDWEEIYSRQSLFLKVDYWFNL